MKDFKLMTYKKILVTGAQRSGTTFIANAIANDLGIKYYDEEILHVNNENILKEILNKESFVIQAPGLFYMIHRLPLDVFVVVLKRDIYNIIKSQLRINWGVVSENIEKVNYVNEWDIKDGLLRQPISFIKYYIWNNKQRNKMKQKFIEYDYSEFKDHHMYESDRINLKPKQIKL